VHAFKVECKKGLAREIWYDMTAMADVSAGMILRLAFGSEKAVVASILCVKGQRMEKVIPRLRVAVFY